MTLQPVLELQGVQGKEGVHWYPHPPLNCSKEGSLAYEPKGNNMNLPSEPHKNLQLHLLTLLPQGCKAWMGAPILNIKKLRSQTKTEKDLRPSSPRPKVLSQEGLGRAITSRGVGPRLGCNAAGKLLPHQCWGTGYSHPARQTGQHHH